MQRTKELETRRRLIIVLLEELRSNSQKGKSHLIKDILLVKLM